MKKMLLMISLFMGVSFFYNAAQAQNISVNINIGSQPAWGPVGYDYVEYYYFPDIDCYYGVNTGFFHYKSRGRWVRAHFLPEPYGHYNLYNLYKVVINGKDPWKHHRKHYKEYAHFKGYKNQYIIRDSRDQRYYNSRGNNVIWYNDKYADKNRYKNDNPNKWKNNDQKWRNDDQRWRNDDRGNRNRYSTDNNKKSNPSKELNKKDNRRDKDNRMSSRSSSRNSNQK